jgi:hypothetical protein
MSKQIITKLAGTIEATNIEHPDGSHGARFTLLLPYNKEKMYDQ